MSHSNYADFLPYTSFAKDVLLVGEPFGNYLNRWIIGTWPYHPILNSIHDFVNSIAVSLNVLDRLVSNYSANYLDYLPELPFQSFLSFSCYVVYTILILKHCYIISHCFYLTCLILGPRWWTPHPDSKNFSSRHFAQMAPSFPLPFRI